MDLIIGGYASGKLLYANSRYMNYKLLDEKNYSLLPEEGPVIMNHLHLIIKDLLEKGMSPMEVHQYVYDMVGKYEDCVVISDEIGNGIVPMEAFERTYREETGRILVNLAKEAKRVVRITCGLEQVLK